MAQDHSIITAPYTRVRVRLAEESDLPSIYRIELESFRDPYPYSLFVWLLQNCSRFFLVAEENGLVVGYAVACVEPEATGHVVSIAVAKKHRRKGIGKALLEELIKRMKEAGLKKDILEVRVSNEPAIRLYEKLGFRAIKRLKSYYSDGEDGWLMSLDL